MALLHTIAERASHTSFSRVPDQRIAFVLNSLDRQGVHYEEFAVLTASLATLRSSAVVQANPLHQTEALQSVLALNHGEEIFRKYCAGPTGHAQSPKFCSAITRAGSRFDNSEPLSLSETPS
jgi:hypothetical protein